MKRGYVTCDVTVCFHSSLFTSFFTVVPSQLSSRLSSQKSLHVFLHSSLFTAFFTVVSSRLSSQWFLHTFLHSSLFTSFFTVASSHLSSHLFSSCFHTYLWLCFHTFPLWTSPNFLAWVLWTSLNFLALVLWTSPNFRALVLWTSPNFWALVLWTLFFFWLCKSPIDWVCMVAAMAISAGVGRVPYVELRCATLSVFQDPICSVRISNVITIIGSHMFSMYVQHNVYSRIP